MDATSPTLPAPTDDVAAGRARIDVLDERILALVAERIATSRAIQAARLAAGGRRIEHSRELVVLDRYRRALGRPGGELALAVLELCRGRG